MGHFRHFVAAMEEEYSPIVHFMHVDAPDPEY
jgi:hypothetical protein